VCCTYDWKFRFVFLIPAAPLGKAHAEPMYQSIKVHEHFRMYADLQGLTRRTVQELLTSFETLLLDDVGREL
jgi:hypothetical protein